MASPYAIRVVGDPVLTQRAEEVTDIDSRLVAVCDDMAVTMYEAPGVGLAAPQVGIQQRFFVYDLQDGEGAKVLINPEIHETEGEWEYQEGCLSIPGLSFEVVRPRRIHVTGIDIDGNDVDFDADDFFARVIQHELDHLDGVLMLERLDSDQLKVAKRELRRRAMQETAATPQADKKTFFSFR